MASPFDEGVAKSILPRLDWAALRKTAAEVSSSAWPAAVTRPRCRPHPSPRCRCHFARQSLTPPPLALWPATAASSPLQLGVAALPEEVPAGAESDAGFLRSVYALVFDIHLEEGNLLCPHCGRAYPVRKGVPNMLLRDDEM